MSSLKKPIKIFARLKPLHGEPSPYEIEQVESDETGNEILVVNMKGDKGDCVQDENANYYAHKTQDIHRFRYSKVFERDVGQTHVFDRVCRPVLDSALSGYNGTVFAYGQTGSGKTFTMTGSRTEYDDRGIIPRALSYVFQKFQERNDGTQLQGVYVSYLEIYNENGYDLLNTGFISSGRLEDLRKVILMEDGNQQIHLKNLSVHPVASEDEALHLFYLGEHNRTIAETPMNEASTRSHCIFTVHLNVREACGSVVRRSKVHLVDLAGSERIANSNISGQLFNEARHINLALHYLEQVIVALGESNRTHIPYRNSMMTSILRDSLGGNCMTSMIATLSLESKNMPETLSTCRFSQRVALVSNAATINEEIDSDVLITQLKAEVKRLKAVIGNSAIVPLSETSSPMGSKEINECWNIVQNYLMDPDEHSILAVAPDMRLVQTCFRCLKMACNMSQSKSMMQMMKFTLPDSESYPEHKKVKDLVQKLAYRDAEIQVLTKMLRNEKEINAKHNFCAISGVELTPRPATSHHSGGLLYSSAQPTKPDYKEKRPLSASTDEELCAMADSLKSNPPYSPVSSPRALIDKETLVLEGLSAKKKAALDIFMETYSGKDELGKAREQLLQQRAEFEKIKDEMNKNHVALNQLQSVVREANPDKGDKSGESLSEAYKAQKRVMALKEVRMKEIEQKIKDCEDNLKLHYGQLVNKFDGWWKGDDPKKSENQENKPLQDVATGVFKKTVEFKQAVPSVKNVGQEAPFLRQSWVEEVGRNILANNSLKDSKSIQRSRRSPREQINTENALTSESKSKKIDSPPHSSRESIKRSEVKNSPGISNFTVYPEEFDNGENVMKEIPMTGDPETDKEIMSFFRTRQAVFRKIHGDKDRLSVKSSKESGRSGV